ncbi:uncharacterized protein PHALS_02525 [Plasmopara halstedii]|uniref:Uncharacterized protein n=1 Tax=Plasmopara halstedii TaxID=4781 RepID=A0A0P1AWV2_PLAHL|nr:uncharacterized protein PHALS_02525 [Plasmopara halstedii]CEG46103.1 hypothetical protein PHALS_02525 [Plasmopara halstedii]|eukprot:XP_024582472.1 hypothetical protein PHALS_02525 [Plasmopara halstedii]
MVLQRLALKNSLADFINRILDTIAGQLEIFFAIKDDAEVGEEFPEDSEALRNFKILSASIC